MKLFNKLLKAGDGKRLKATKAIVEPVNALEPEFERLSDEQLAAKTTEFRQRIENGADLDDLLTEAFATVREAARREIGQRHYDVQLMGGAALHWGWVAEMRTGEGKTLVSTLPVYLNALGGKGVHAITVNEYLARRDSEWMGQIHRRLGLTVGLIVPGMNDSAIKRAQYACDVTHGTNNEFGFDYLRDNMARSRADMVQRGHAYAIVDEVDSILIDEARTPLIISGKVKGAADLYYRFRDVVTQLTRDDDYEVDEEKRIVAILDDGITKVEDILEIDNLYDGIQGDFVHQLNSALRAKELFHKDKDYLVVDGEVKIVDEFTGRVLDGRRWSDGLHQAVEAKEKVQIKEEQQTLATVTLQNYFRMYDKLSGMTGTALGDAVELETTYNLPVVQIPTNRPIQRLDESDLIFKSELAKYSAVCDDLEQRVAKGQPVLVGTASVEKSEVLSKILRDRNVAHEVLNAKQHTREADIVAQAGQPGSVTVATNMAGRGVDIVLGGNAEKLAERDTLAAGHALPVSDAPNEADGDSEAEIEAAQQAKEAAAYYAKRLSYWEAITVEQGKKALDAGGLYVLATERHESRRIDDQLRGRAGRQGDPGESRFYLSLEDDLMRIFASGASSWVMDKALAEDEAIESKMVSKSVERAQSTVEQRNAETRKNVLKYDEVFNEQRKVVYTRRMQVLDQGDLREDSISSIGDVAKVLVETHCLDELEDAWDVDSLHADLHTFWPSKISTEEMSNVKGLDALIEKINAEGIEFYEAKETEIGAELMRQIERQIILQLSDQRWREHLTEMDHLREGINLRAMGQRDPLTEWQREGFDLFSSMMTSLSADFVKYLMHVQVTKQGAPTSAGVKPQAAVEGPTDVTTNRAAPEPANAQKQAATRVAARRSAGGRAQGSRPAANRAPVATNVRAAKADAKSLLSDKAEPKVAEPKPQTVVNDDWDKTGRNDPCPCGSGKKFKQCHG